MNECMYVWGMGHSPAPAPLPSIIYCVFPLINHLSYISNEMEDFIYGGFYHEELAQVTKS
jgi:hypothetical protein